MKSRKLKLIIFDLDGTLVNAFKAVSRSLNYALKEVGLSPLDRYTIERQVGWGDRNLIESFVPGHLVDEALSIFRKHHKFFLTQGIHFLPGAKQILKTLKLKKYKLAIASNRPSPFTNIILKKLDMQKFFHCVLCADKVKRPKPSGMILTEILARLDMKPREALYVGDMAIDVQTGHKARVKTVSVVTGSYTRQEIAPYKPFKIIDDILEVSDIVDKINLRKD